MSRMTNAKCPSSEQRTQTGDLEKVRQCYISLPNKAKKKTEEKSAKQLVKRPFSLQPALSTMEAADQSTDGASQSRTDQQQKDEAPESAAQKTTENETGALMNEQESTSRESPEEQHSDNPNADQALHFRKRRLSLPKHRLEAATQAAAAAVAGSRVNCDEEEGFDANQVTALRNQKHSSADDTSQENSDPLQRSEDDQHQSQNDQQSACGSNDNDEKAHTFRKRRLSLTFNRMSSADTEDNGDKNDIDNNSHHRSTSLASSTDGEEIPFIPEAKRQRRLSTAESSVASSSASASGTSSQKRQQRLNKPRILHSAEMISGPFAPPSPIHQNTVLHQQNPLPPTQSSVLDEHVVVIPGSASANHDGTATPSASPPHSPCLESHSLVFSPRRQRTRSSGSQGRRMSWKQRHYLSDEAMLPFPKDIVGTYSCHGIEPIYDDIDYYAMQQQQQAHEQQQEQQYPPILSPQDKQNNNHNSFWEEEEEEDEEEEQDQQNGLENPVLLPLGEQQNGLEQPSQQEIMPVVSAKINQDRGGITYPYANCNRTALFAVYDGHGQGGELVSQFALHEIQRRLEKHPQFHKKLDMAMRETFLKVDEALKQEPIIEPFFAGTTACVALLQDTQLTFANAGDSRAVLGRRQEGTQGWETVDLTQDQNPDSPLEMERILKLGGYVSPPPGPGLSARVWLDAEMTQIGLAMARSIGDHAVSDVGVIADPVISTHTITPGDEFMILASDGVWEFLSSQDAVEIVGAHLVETGATKACQALIEAAALKWHEEEGEYRDDITAIVIHLPRLWGETTTSPGDETKKRSRSNGSETS